MRKIDYLCKWVSKCKVIESRDEDHLHVFLQYVFKQENARSNTSRPTISLFMENNINRGKRIYMPSDLPPLPVGGVYIRSATCPHTSPSSAYPWRALLFTAYRTTQPCPLGTRPLPARDLSAPAHEKAAAYFRRFTVIVSYGRYKLVQLAYAVLSPSSRCIPFHSLAECRTRRTFRLQRSLVSLLKARVFPRTCMAIAIDAQISAHALKGLIYWPGQLKFLRIQ
jgi:hypothetical protein